VHGNKQAAATQVTSRVCLRLPGDLPQEYSPEEADLAVRLRDGDGDRVRMDIEA
jgi:hypothetical protein